MVAFHAESVTSPPLGKRRKEERRVALFSLLPSLTLSLDNSSREPTFIRESKRREEWEEMEHNRLRIGRMRENGEGERGGYAWAILTTSHLRMRFPICWNAQNSGWHGKSTRQRDKRIVVKSTQPIKVICALNRGLMATVITATDVARHLSKKKQY